MTMVRTECRTSFSSLYVFICAFVYLCIVIVYLGHGIKKCILGQFCGIEMTKTYNFYRFLLEMCDCSRVHLVALSFIIDYVLKSNLVKCE